MERVMAMRHRFPVFWIGVVMLAVSASVCGAGDRAADSTPVEPTETSATDVFSRVHSLLQARTRTPEKVESVTFLLRQPVGRAWPPIAIRDIKKTGSGHIAFVNDDPRGYAAGDTIKGAQVVAVAPESITLELEGERRVVRRARAFPEIVVSSITQVEGIRVVLLKNVPKPYCQGDVHDGVTIVAINESSVTVEFNGQKRVIQPVVQKRSFPNLAVAGIMLTQTNRIVFFEGESSPRKAGETVQGARIVDVKADGVTVEFEGEQRWLPLGQGQR